MPQERRRASTAREPAAGQPTGRREKWESFWRGEQVEAEATHRLSAELCLAWIRAEEFAGRAPRVLDLGCGGGRVMGILERAGCAVVGADLAAGALGAAQTALGPKARLVQTDAFQLGLASGSFDVVLSLGYASVGSYPGVQGELARVLRSGGLALVDFRRVGLYHLPLVALYGWRWLRAQQQGQVSLPLLGYRPARSWAAASLYLQEVRLFNTYPPLGARLPATMALAFERQLGRLFAPLLARTALAMFRRA